MTLEQLEAQHERQTNDGCAASLRARARSLAISLGVTAPAWATIRMQGRPLRGGAPLTLAELEAKHTASAARSHSARLRTRARALALKLGEPAPAWAAMKSQPRAAASFLGPQPSEPRSETRAVCADIPDALRAWARKHSAVIQIGQSGCVVHPFQQPAQSFPDPHTAALALCG